MNRSIYNYIEILYLLLISHNKLIYIYIVDIGL